MRMKIKTYPIEKYDFYQFKNDKGGITVVAVTSYGGKRVKAYAKCDPRDEFDLDKGKKLGAARCNTKVAEKRYARASAKYTDSVKQLEIAKNNFVKSREFFMDADDQLEEAYKALTKIEEEFNIKSGE